jgi:hypothetical protein
MRVLLLALACLAAVPAWAQRVQAGLDCRFTGTDFVYHCVIRLERGGAPLTGVQITLGADMPSMPMAHNIKPVKATPGRDAGSYEARLDLEMTGEWALKLRLAGPVRDLLVLHYEFDEKGSRPVIRSSKPPRK